MKYFLILVPLFFIYHSSFSQTPPKREFRGAWISTVYNLDWPSVKGNVASQKAELITLLDSLKSAGINAVFFQVRTACDALYNSSFEPWSYWLTGVQGTAPSPLYDPLTFAIAEAHKRGIELHAWFNPYRAVEGSAALSSNHVANKHPEWILTVGTGAKKILNPGLQEVRDYNVQVIMDVVSRYDIDGVHFDDYFYPYSPNSITTEDNATFAAYPRGFSSIASWRRDNINIFIKSVNDNIKLAKPYVKFGISPFGIWKSGTPAGISGTSAYSELYSDAIAWLQAKSVDYIAPQLYWKIGGAQDYSSLLNWWADAANTNGRHIYPGQIFSAGYSVSELPDQLNLNRNNSKVGGSVFFRAANIKDNTLTFKELLRTTYNKYPALMPVMTWMDNVNPNPPLNAAAVNSSGKTVLSWDLPGAASDGDIAKFFVIYRSLVSPVDITKAENILFISTDNATQYTENSVQTGKTYYYKITALDKCNNESTSSSELSAVALPVELISFTASALGNAVRLDWSTATEINNFGFDIERAAVNNLSDDSPLWQRIAFVKGNGNICSPVAYSFTDANILPSVKYLYRLRQTDFDGSFKYSFVAEATSPSVSGFELFANYPNPFNPSTSISYSVPAECSVRLTVFNSLGQEVARLVNSVQAEGHYSVHWNPGILSSGIYMYRLEALPGGHASPFVSVKKMLFVK